MRLIMAILGVALVGPWMAQAQQLSPQPSALSAAATSATPGSTAAATNPLASIPPAKVQDIRTLLELAGAKTRMQQVMGEMERTMRPLMTNALPAGEYREKLVEAFFVKFHAKLDLQPLLDQAVISYDHHFTHDEIKQLIQFYQSPIGKKMT